jgi:VanZ family protein
MKYIFRHYPVTLALATLIIFLSCFKPPRTSLENIANFDKVVHCGMYFCFSMLAWVEFFRAQRHADKYVWWHGWVVGFIIPLFLGALMEVVQKYCTTYRSFEWGDILADSLGVLLTAIIAEVFIRKHF